jgi:hypothetical protein
MWEEVEVVVEEALEGGGGSFDALIGRGLGAVDKGREGRQW